MMKNVNVTLRVDEELKKQADDLFSELGLNLSTAFTIFLRQSVREQQIPFRVSKNVPNAVTLAAIEAAEKGEDLYGPYESVSELMEAQRDALGDRARHIAPKPLLLAATGNAHKLKELQEIFRDYYTIAPMSAAGFFGPIDENASTFAGNAAIKAEAVCAATGFPAIADDSGLCVEVLDGEPGVMSARYAGGHGDDEANNDLLLRRMDGKTDRQASFRCALALKLPGKEPYIAEGSCPGTILYERRGTGGFGYDPLFLYEPMGKTYAEMNAEEKNKISHRARAAREMVKIMERISREGK